ncbi:FkbM family methyltransferase [Polyangium aurulentum]|uniref:FkbM family methyltransferase n=1 Tax=Polyangium aurulentum TaxID=2567896 RepID=UPI0010AE9C05|nr:FkbM family methyltransferase [Polyangium aurulentum]UQA62413.1 FkbM family methyltransferase [Polyangium aurulentum]
MKTLAKDLVRSLGARVISRVGAVPVVGPALRSLARGYPEGSVVTIKSGHAAGMRWKRHHRYVNGYWVGNYEYPIQELFARHLGPGDVFYDIGANAGFFTLLAARRVGPSGRVYAFEPVPDNLASVREQIEVNRLEHAEAVGAAVGRSAGRLALRYSPGASAMARLAHVGKAQPDETTLDVEVVCLDDFLKDHRAPTMMKIDVEGAEGEVLEGARSALEKGPKLLIEVHGRACGEAVVGILRPLGYEFERVDGSRPERPEDEPHLLALRR